jgi:anti-sigma regulatory factor (Ser/Thr protein kinase)
MCERLEFELPVGPSAPSQARRAVREVAILPEGTRADAMLLVSELVTNAVIHAERSAADTVRLTLHRDADRLLIEVDDHGEPSDRRRGISAGKARKDTPGAGLGLKIVERLAEHWEVQGSRVSATLRWH